MQANKMLKKIESRKQAKLKAKNYPASLIFALLIGYNLLLR